MGRLFLDCPPSALATSMHVLSSLTGFHLAIPSPLFPILQLSGLLSWHARLAEQYSGAIQQLLLWGTADDSGQIAVVRSLALLLPVLELLVLVLLMPPKWFLAGALVTAALTTQMTQLTSAQPSH